ncbi:pleckstrin homology domain-containing family A member 8-like [Corticium candelabrum]|uniref:pleckstrin homology domain-containing family A member 8-like n=1 Tax=Corticium candelabrum TaxID=121492 RepID=UPI002E2627F6|nr:pleckstrin homology domain-containing family A member 8-like [Corticium candelabrum]
MEGILYKWTNYITGWQSRWFKLETPAGVLSYYRNEDEVGQASRGSVKMACCDIAVHQTDSLRLDLHIPGQQRMYLRAPTTQDRQKWLVALGSAKACLLDSNATGEVGIPLSVGGLKEKMAELHMVCQLVVNQVADIKMYASKQPECVQSLNESVTLLSATCDTFLFVLADCMDMADHSMTTIESPTSAHTDMTFHQFNIALHSKLKTSSSSQTLHILKDRISSRQETTSSTPSLTNSPSHTHDTPDISHKQILERLREPQTKIETETTTERTPTHTLSDHAHVSQTTNNNQPVYYIQASLENPQFRSNLLDSEQLVCADHDTSRSRPSTQSVSEFELQTNAHRVVSPALSESSQNDTFQSAGSSPIISPTISHTHLDDVDGATEKVCASGDEESARHGAQAQHPSIVQSQSDMSVIVRPFRQYETFFSKASVKFEDIDGGDDGVPTKLFLDACTAILPLLDTLGGTTFAPVKMDINGNITKLMKKFESNPQQHTSLQAMINIEISSKTCAAKNSAADALLWLKRALEFIHVFLVEVSRGQQDLTVAAGNAYEQTLRQHHNWIVRGVFALAVKTVPYRSTLMKALGQQEGTGEEQVLEDMRTMLQGLQRILFSLKSFYGKHNLDASAVA